MIDAAFKPAKLLEAGKQQFTVRMQRVLETQAGYSENASGYRLYLGSPWKTGARYRFSAGTYFSVGITAEKDAGEQFFRETQKAGFDFYSFHLFARPGKRVVAFAVGDYQVQFGKGLTAWGGMAPGKSADVLGVKRQGRGIRPYASSGESDFLRGVAVSMKAGKYLIDCWGSYRNLDAGFMPLDTAYESFGVSSFYATGLHRSWSELDGKDAVQQYVAGLHGARRWKHLNLELTLQHTTFSSPLAAGSDAYELYEASGRSFTGLGIAHAWLVRNCHFFGEITSDADRTIAVAEGCVMAIGTRLSATVYYRNLPPDFHVQGNNPLRESSKPWNERGTYAGLQYQLNAEYKLSASLDHFTFPWMRYAVSGSTDGKEYSGRLTYTIGKIGEAYVEYRCQEKAQDNNSEAVTYTEPIRRSNIRFHVRYKFPAGFVWQQRVEYVDAGMVKEHGSLIYEDVQYKPMGKRYSVSVRYCLFKTGGYDSRLYTWEQDPPGSGSMPVVYMAGSRYSVMVRYRITRMIECWVKYSAAIFDAQTTIGSGPEQSNGNKRSELKLQMRMTF